MTLTEHTHEDFAYVFSFKASNHTVRYVYPDLEMRKVSQHH